jgi:hypothetical protein
VLKLPINRIVTCLMLAITTFGGLLASAPAWGQSVLPPDVAFVTAPLIGVLIGTPGFVGMCMMVRCRHCRYRLFWHAVAKRDHTNGIGWFLTAKECPKCGQSGA